MNIFPFLPNLWAPSTCPGVPVQDPFVFIGTFTIELEIPPSISELWPSLESPLENRNRKLCSSQCPMLWIFTYSNHWNLKNGICFSGTASDWLTHVSIMQCPSLENSSLWQPPVDGHWQLANKICSFQCTTSWMVPSLTDMCSSVEISKGYKYWKQGHLVIRFPPELNRTYSGIALCPSLVWWIELCHHP